MEALQALKDLKFQSPCAGNMFGKHKDAPQCNRIARQSCGFNPRVRGTCLVSLSHGTTSPTSTECLVSIPVCGEHVW